MNVSTSSTLHSHGLRSVCCTVGHTAIAKVVGLSLLLTTLLTLSACDNGPLGPRVHIDFADFIVYNT